MVGTLERRASEPAPTEPTLRPPVRWAGGKYAIVDQLVRFAPKSFRRYIEPMAGSAAMFFALQPSRAVLSDLNEDLINFYTSLRDDPRCLIRRLARMAASESTYYRLRKSKPNDNLESARNFAYLNRLCWNGVYRVNKEGNFNVPIGDRLPEKLWQSEHLYRCSEILRNAALRSEDVFKLLPKARKDDFVFLDPPYPKRSSDGLGYNRYTPARFTLESHKRLAVLARDLSRRGVKIMITIADKKELISVYSEGFKVAKLATRSLISCSGSSRGRCREVILTNY